ncbi:MAG: hypothetical protein IJA82_01995 [Clostridia bacterium]|nr:hypothetical protein [Clostridia bacterium]
MRKTKRLLTTALICMLCILSLNVTAFAAMPDNGVEPCYDNISTATLDIGYFDDVGLVTASATKQLGTIKMVGVVNVYESVNGEWEFVDSYANESTRGSLVVSGEFEATLGKTYKAVFTISAMDDTTVETDVLECVKTYN